MRTKFRLKVPNEMTVIDATAAFCMRSFQLNHYGTWIEEDVWLPNKNEKQPKVRIARVNLVIVEELPYEEPEEEIQKQIYSLGSDDSEDSEDKPFKVSIIWKRSVDRLFSQKVETLLVNDMSVEDGVLMLDLCDEKSEYITTRHIPLIHINYYDAPRREATY